LEKTRGLLPNTKGGKKNQRDEGGKWQCEVHPEGGREKGKLEPEINMKGTYTKIIKSAANIGALQVAHVYRQGEKRATK